MPFALCSLPDVPSWILPESEPETSIWGKVIYSGEDPGKHRRGGWGCGTGKTHNPIVSENCEQWRLNPLGISDSVECTSTSPPPQSKEAGVFISCSIGRCGLLLVGTSLPRTSRLLPALAELYLRQVSSGVKEYPHGECQGDVRHWQHLLPRLSLL